MSKEELKNLQKKILEDVEFFMDDNSDEFYAKYKFQGHYETHPTSSQIFIAHLDATLRRLSSKYDTGDWFEVIKVKKQNCLLNDSPTNIYRRIAGNEKAIWYFLADRDWSCVYVTKDGWSVINTADKLFTKPKNMKQQVVPISDCNEDRLRDYVNLNDKDYLLFKINIIHNFFYISSHYIGIINADFGHGKSMLTRLWRRIVDPAKAEFTSLSSNIDDFKIQLANNDFVMLDNTTKLKNDFSNIICGAVTGSSFSLRQLYTDCTELILKVKNIFVINGIDIVPRRQDLLSRCLLFELLPISNDKRRTESEFWSSFEKDLPYILGSIFDILSIALEKLETLENVPSGRMADATREMLAIALALGVSQDEFYTLLNENQEKLKSACSKENELVVTILDYMESTIKNSIAGRVSDVFNSIREFKKGDLKSFPKAPSAFSRKINEQKDLLLASGISVTTTEKRDGTYITITRNPQTYK